VQHLILASSSPYRKALLGRLRLPFETISPDFKEARTGSLAPQALVQHNTLGKAKSILDKYPQATVIASDQIAVCGDVVLEKPGDFETACQQLRLASGQSVIFLTGLTVVSAQSEQFEIIPFQVFFRELADEEIRTYVGTEKPLDCAGSFKSEGLGISLFERMRGDDPTALIGLPLIRLSQWLQPLAHIQRR